MNSILHEILNYLGPILAAYVVTEAGKLAGVFNKLGPAVHGIVAAALTYFAASASGQPVSQDWVLAALQGLVQVLFPVQQALKAHRAAKGLTH